MRFYKADSMLKFMKWGWIDLISSIPALPIARVGRRFRLVRLLRILRTFRSSRILLNYIFINRVKGTMTAVELITILVVIVSSISILIVENNPASIIKSAEDAI
jgi:voltage-gated potassium channel